MRLDKYLKVSRLIRRRTIAKSASDDGFIYVNDKIQKPAYRVKIDDVIKINFAAKIVKVKVTSLKPIKNELMYKLIKEEKVTTF